MTECKRNVGCHQNLDLVGNDESRRCKKYILKQPVERILCIQQQKGLQRLMSGYQKSSESVRGFMEQGILLESVESRGIKTTGGKDCMDSEETKEWEQNLDRGGFKRLVTIDGEGVDWTTHSEHENYALMACNSSDSDTEIVISNEKRMARKADLNNGWNNVQRVNKQNQFVPSAVLTRTGKIPVNTAKASSTKNFSTAKQRFNRQTVLTSTAMKVNTVKPIMNRVRTTNVFFKTHSPSSRPFKKTTVLRTDFSNQKLNTAKVNAVSTVGGQRETAVKSPESLECSWTMTGNSRPLPYLAEFQDFNGGPVAFGGSKGYITGKGKIKTSKLDFEDFKSPDEIKDSEIEDESAQDCFVLPIWPSYSSKITPVVQTDDKREGPREEEQVFMDELERLKRQKKEANEEAEALRKKFEQETENLVIQAGAISTANAHEGLYLSDPTNPEEDDSEIPPLEDIYQNSNDGIFTTSSYDDEGAVVKTQKQMAFIVWSPCFCSYVQKQEEIIKYFRALFLCLVSCLMMKQEDFSNALEDESWVDAMQEELLQFKIQKVWVLVDLPYGKKAIVYQMDVMKSAFLYGKIDEGDMATEEQTLVPIDQKLFHKEGDKHDIMTVHVYVDDIISLAVYKEILALKCDDFEALMKSKFQMSSMGELTFFLGLQVKQKADGIFISQDKYVAEILKKFDFANVKTASTPIETQKPLVKDEEASDVDVHLYRSMIGSLMYLTASRPDIMFAVCACSRFQVTPKSSHLSAVKRIFRYLKGKPKLGLWYPRVSSFDLESYSDSDYAGANLDRKSTTRAPLHRDAYEKKLIQVLKINTDDNVADLLTKAFDVSIYQFLVYFEVIVMRSVTDGPEGTPDTTLFFFDWTSLVPDCAKSFTRSLIFLSKFHSSCSHSGHVLFRVVSISEASIRSDLLFDDADGIDSLPNQAIFDAIQLMGSVSCKYLLVKSFFMVKKGKHFSGKVTPLFATMLVQPTQVEGASLERPSEAQPTPSPAPTSEVPHEPQTDSSPAHTSEVPIEQQTDPSPRPSPSPIIPDPIPETSGGNLGGHSSSDKSLSGNEGELTLQSIYDLCLSLCAQVSDQAKEIQHLKAQIKKLKKQAKPVIHHHRAWLKSVSLKQRLTRKSFPKKQRVHKESVSKQGRKFAKGEPSVQRDPLFDELPEDTVDHMETENAQDVGRTREIVDEEKELDEDILSTEDRSEAIRNRPPTKNQLRNQMMTYLKHVGNFKHAELKIKKFEEIQALYEKIKRSDEDFISIGSAEDEKLIKRMNEKGIDSSKSEIIKEESKGIEVQEEDLNAVYQLVMDRYQGEIPEGFDRVLWGDLMIMFNPDDENEFWNSQQDWNIVSWIALVYSVEEDQYYGIELIKFVNKLLAELEPETKVDRIEKTAADAKVAIQDMVEYSQKWHNGTLRTRSTETSDGLATIQAQLNNLGREIKKVNEKVYAAQVGCEQLSSFDYILECDEEQGDSSTIPLELFPNYSRSKLRLRSVELDDLSLEFRALFIHKLKASVGKRWQAK
ncbi:putative ribonuclease H-like domain-containing protein, partial [Tanacetum coccineum]